MNDSFEEQVRNWTEMAEKHPDKIGELGYGSDGYMQVVKNVDGVWGIYRKNSWTMPILKDEELNTPVKTFENAEDAMRYAIEKLTKDVDPVKKKLETIANKLEKLNFHKEASLIDKIIVKLAADPPDTVFNAIVLVDLTLEAIQNVDMDKAIDEAKKVKNYIQSTFDEALSEYDIHFEAVDKEKMEKEVVEAMKAMDNDEIRKIGKLFNEVQDKSKSKVEVQKLDKMENDFFNRDEVQYIINKMQSVKDKLQEWQDQIDVVSRQRQNMDERREKE